jgi:HNH endonuclease
MRDRKSDAHRKAAQHKLGRAIKPGHDIDHLNENKDDNSPGNLHEKPHGAHTAKSNKSRSLAKLQKSLAMVRKGERSY